MVNYSFTVVWNTNQQQRALAKRPFRCFFLASYSEQYNTGSARQNAKFKAFCSEISGALSCLSATQPKIPLDKLIAAL